MKILVFSSLYPNNVWPNNGIFIKERVKNVLSLNGADIKVVAPVPYFPPLKISSRWAFSQVVQQERCDDMDVFHPRFFMTPKIGMSTYGWMMYRSVLSTVKKLHQQFDFDLIDAHYIYPDCYAAILLGRYFNKPVIVSARGSDINQFTTFPIIRKLINFTLDNADHVVAVSRALKDVMVNLGVPPEKISVIPNGVDQEKFSPLDKKIAMQRLNLPEGKIIFSAGTLRRLKGFDILIHSVRKILTKSRDKRIYLIIAGEGKVRQDLESLIVQHSLGEHVHLVGAKSQDDLKLYYNAADVFCLASSREGWPNVIMEALACGTPVVATNVGGIPEIITSDRLGMLAKRHPDDFSEQIETALNKTWDHQYISTHMQDYTWNRIASALSHQFESVLGEKKEPSLIEEQL